MKKNRYKTLLKLKTCMLQDTLLREWKDNPETERPSSQQHGWTRAYHI